jgi:hypothetical protein
VRAQRGSVQDPCKGASAQALGSVGLLRKQLDKRRDDLLKNLRVLPCIDAGQYAEVADEELALVAAARAVVRDLVAAAHRKAAKLLVPCEERFDLGRKHFHTLPVLPAPSARAIAGRRFNASLTLVLDVAIECQAPPGTLAAEQDGTRQYTPCERRADRLLGEADLLHEILVVPKQPFMVHHTVFPPVADRGHPDGESLTGWGNRLAITGGHRLGEGSGHDAGYRRRRRRNRPPARQERLVPGAFAFLRMH